MPATMTKKNTKSKSRVISDVELEKARKLAGRKKGVTRLQLAEALKIPTSRAARILAALGLNPRPLGEGGGKANRTLVFYTYPSI